jgi:4-hydroxy-tetrahydrodipicolinate synthase
MTELDAARHARTRIAGVLSPVLTPFDAALRPDRERFVRHCRWLLANDVGLAVFGTNSEANSLGIDERIELLDTLVDEGIDPQRMMPGTGCCALTDTVKLTRHAVSRGCAGVLMLPPFYYKGVSDEGLYRAYAEVIERVGDTRLNVYLYHIPPVAQVGISHALIERLLKAYPGTIAGIKDSSGDWNNTMAMLGRFAAAGLDVFVGSETFLLANMRGGGRGCISATANVNPAAIARLHRESGGDHADELQSRCDVVRKTFAAYPMIAAMKRAAAHYGGDEEWARVRPPLVELGAGDSRKLLGELQAIGFAMPGFAALEAAA